MCVVGEVIPVCGPNAPGITQVYWVDVDSITTMPTLNVSTLQTTGNFVMAGLSLFKKLEVIAEESDFDDSMAGPHYGAHFTHKLMAKVKGQSQAANAALSQAVGAKCVLLVVFPNGDVRILGTKSNPAFITKLDSKSGKKGSTDVAGNDIEIVSTGHITKAPYYTGTMPI